MIEENLLHQFASFNTIFTLSCLTSDELAIPAETYRQNGPSNVIFRSGGGATNKVTTIYEDMLGGQVEFFIDDVVIDSLVSPNLKSRTSTATYIEFRVSEPYSMGLFMQTLQIASIQSGYTNYIESPFMLSCEFIGMDDDGDILVTQEGRNLRRDFPLKLTNIELDVSRGGTTYQVEALPWNEQAFTDDVQNLNSDVMLKGNSIVQLLQTGEQSLTTIVNGRLEELRKQNQLLEADEVVITFPNDISTIYNPVTQANSTNNGSTAPAGRGGRGALGNVIGALAVGGIVAGLAGGGRSGGIFGSIDKSLGGLLTNFKSGNIQGLFQSISGALGAQAPQNFEAFLSMITGQVLTKSNIGENISRIAQDPNSVNLVGQSRIISDFTEGGQAPMAQTGQIYDKKNKVMTRAKNVISNDERNFNFPSGTNYTRIIEKVILSSMWSRELKERSPDENGMIDWFRIDAETYLKPNANQESVYGTNAKIYHYKVVPYKVHHSHLQMSQQAGRSYDAIRENVAKEYNYIYSGQNTDIVDFNIRLNGAFRQYIQSDAGQGSFDAKTGSTQQNVTAQKTEQLGLDTSAQGVLSATGATVQIFNNSTSNNGNGGSGLDNSKLRWAKQFHDNILGSGSIDLVEVDLEIFGDPYFIFDSGLGNFTAEAAGLNINTDGQLEYQRSECDVILNFRTPIDYDEDMGTVVFPEETILVSQFSGLYKVISISNRFNGGKFLQVIKLLRRRGQPEDTTNASPSGTYKIKDAPIQEQMYSPYKD